MGYLHIATRSHLDHLLNKRPGETKLGEMVQVVAAGNWQQELAASSARFVLLGIPEDIGVRANYGVGGAHTLWEPALKAILNVQHTQRLNGEQLLVLGDFNFRDLMQQAEHADVQRLRELVAEIDEVVFPVVRDIVAAGKIPIVIGGGHNNAYPLLKGSSEGAGKPVNCLNLDAHSDYRIMEGRHSGNGFRYARKKGYLDLYALVALHENYNAQEVIAELEADPGILFSTYEDIFIHKRLDYDSAVGNAIAHTRGNRAGIELDLDSIEHILSSAATPSGVSVLQARQYVAACARNVNAAYLHLAEGAVKMKHGREDLYTAKLVAYLVTDFIKNVPV
ncbi:MAG: formimidoylglutamase [Flavipsychrobacter sp.]|nr:formimidoylglutamase [Flavipsychrobacter sp.]